MLLNHLGSPDYLDQSLLGIYNKEFTILFI